MFLVIEGDNGTGKDTLAQGLEKYGFKILTYDDRAKKFEKVAREGKKEEKIKRFLAYGKACSDFVTESKSKNENVILIRYWISTLAAAYADEVYDYNKISNIIDTIYQKLEKPDLLLRLNCSFDERVQRIQNRKSANFDDVTHKRAERYEWISDKIKEKVDFKWKEIDTSNKTVEDIRKEVLGIIGVRENSNELEI